MEFLNNITIPNSCEFRTGTEYEPISFFYGAIPISKKFDILLGYFSSSAIMILSEVFASFIVNGGVMRMITNHIISQKDLDTLKKAKNIFNYEIPRDDYLLYDYNKLIENLSEYGEHFFDCIAYLIYHGRIKLIPIKPKYGEGISHYKSGILSDGYNKIKFKSSCNFTSHGLLENLEELEIKRSWGYGIEINAIKEYENYFEMIFSGNADFVEYLDLGQLEKLICQNREIKDLKELIYNEKELLEKKKKIYKKNPDIIKIILKNEERLNNIYKNPHFPLGQEPRDYQVKAYDNWKKNNNKGIFAMATGTGKTKTALYCIQKEFENKNKYNTFVFVPSKVLVDQWYEEATKFNFKEIYLVNSTINWKKNLIRLKNDLKWNDNVNFMIISTYDSFLTTNFQNIISNFPVDSIIIADEAHNIGAPSLKKTFLKLNFNNRIALSATPKRIYDPEGSSVIEEIFNDKPPYCCNFPLEKAIEKGYLCRYYYYPKKVELNEEEMEKYIELSEKIMQLFDSSKNEFKENEIVKKISIKRKRIIYGCKQKFNIFRKIINEITKVKPLKYCFVYVPFGMFNNNNEFIYYINEYIKILNEIDPNLRINSILEGDNESISKLNAFSNGDIDVLFAKKCLDEGIDVPRAEIGIFISSTGNPREFIQRRGRLLRLHKDKKFSYIYDMVVMPIENSINNRTYKIEKSLLKNELTRVSYFANSSLNFYDSKKEFDTYCNHYNIDIDTIKTEL